MPRDYCVHAMAIPCSKEGAYRQLSGFIAVVDNFIDNNFLSFEQTANIVSTMGLRLWALASSDCETYPFSLF